MHSAHPRASRRLRSALALFVVWLAPSLVTPGASHAQSPESEEDADAPERLVYNERIAVTGTGQRERVDTLPLPLSVITREEIDNSQEGSVDDLLRRIPGITVMRAGDEGSPTSVFVRGTESEHVLSLFDGVRLNSPYFAGYDWSVQPTAGIEQIEVARGPFSALWGPDAIGGVINVIPGRGTDQLNVLLFGESGSDDWQRLEGTLGWGNDRWDAYASGFSRDGRGELDNSDFTNRQLLADAGYSWASGNRAALLFQELDAEIGVPFYDPLTPTPRRRTDSKQLLLAVPVSLQPSAHWSLELSPSWVERELTFRDPDDPFGFVSSDTFADTAQLRLSSHHALGSGPERRHDFSWGGEWREDRVDSGSNFGIDLDDDRSSLYGVFAQDVWRATDRLTLIGGLRYDDSDEWGSQLSPRLSVGFNVTPVVELRASYGEAFRQPSIGELYYPFSGNPELEPERSRSADVGVGLRPGRHRIDAFLFATDTSDLITYDFATFRFANIEETEIRGAELAWAAPLVERLLSSLSATWLHTEDQLGLTLLRRPEWSASWTLDGRILERLRGDLGLFYVGSRADVDALSFERKELGSYLTANLGLSYDVVGGLEVTARVQNLADREYQEVDGYPAPGRRFMAGLRWTR